MTGFIIVAGMAMAILAMVVLPPAYQRRGGVFAERAALAAQVQANDRLIEYNERLIEAVKVDPILIERLMMQQFNLTRPGEKAVRIADAPEDPPIAAMLAAQAPPPAPLPPLLKRLTERVEQPSTRRGLLLLAGLLLISAMVLFAPPGPKDRAPRQ